MGHRLTPGVRSDLDEIWYNVAKESGGETIADRVIDNLTERFYLLGEHPRIGRVRPDLRPGLRSYAVGEYQIVYTLSGSDAEILYVFPARRDIPNLLDR